MVAMPHWPKYITTGKINYDLSRMSYLLNCLGKPHLALPAVIHVAGTNGKGSSISYLKSIFHAANYKTHCYISPHLIEFNERITVSSEPISDEMLFSICEQVRLVCEKHNIEPSFFEASTAIAFVAFATNNADVVLLETGLGGRLDATNVIPKPLLSIITPISFDHMNILGDKIELIAAEKAGIIKKATPCAISNQLEEVLDVLIAKCQQQQAPAICYGYDFGIEKTNNGFNFLSKQRQITLPNPALPGDHQLLNAATVIASLSLAQDKFNFSDQHFCKGLQEAKWPARIQKVPQSSYTKILDTGAQIWIDGAHNPHGAKVLANWIRDELKAPVKLIIGITKNRDVYSFLSEFAGIYEEIAAVPVLSEPFSYSADVLSSLADEHNIMTIPYLSLEDALTKMNKDSFKGHIVITGSLFLAADFFKLIGIKYL